MASVVSFTFNPFQENTYLVIDEDGSCVIIDPGCYDAVERALLKRYIDEHQLRPVRLLNTHCHLDHIFGNRFVAGTWNLPLEIHEGELPVLKMAPISGQVYGIPMPDEGLEPGAFLKEGEEVRFGTTTLEILFTPGHSPASVSFYSEADGFIIAGDVLFQGSIGRTDLPGGDYDTLIQSIREQLLCLPDEVQVFSGHGDPTSIGEERRHNPFLQD
jgi:hydroxyacylglutathione hydrolase